MKIKQWGLTRYTEVHSGRKKLAFLAQTAASHIDFCYIKAGWCKRLEVALIRQCHRSCLRMPIAVQEKLTKIQAALLSKTTSSILHPAAQGVPVNSQIPSSPTRRGDAHKGGSHLEISTMTDPGVRKYVTMDGP